MSTFSAFAKTRLAIIALAATALLGGLAACEEIPPTLNLVTSGGPDTSGTDLAQQPRGVLVEEFTGVKCVNCPAGAEAIAQLKLIYGDRLVPVGLHTGFFARPYPESTIDFRTSDGDAIEAFIGSPSGYPSAVIDRKLFQGEASLQLAQSTWAGYIGQQINEPPVISIGLDVTTNSEDGTLDVKVDLLGRSSTDGRDLYLSLFLLENNIVDVQLTPQGKDFEYSHKHVLREAITAPIGENIGSFTQGQTDTREYSINLAADYVVDNLEVVGVVHFADTDNGGKEVQQAVVRKLAL